MQYLRLSSVIFTLRTSHADQFPEIPHSATDHPSRQSRRGQSPAASLPYFGFSRRAITRYGIAYACYTCQASQTRIDLTQFHVHVYSLSLELSAHVKGTQLLLSASQPCGLRPAVWRASLEVPAYAPQRPVLPVGALRWLGTIPICTTAHAVTVTSKSAIGKVHILYCGISIQPSTASNHLPTKSPCF